MKKLMKLCLVFIVSIGIIGCSQETEQTDNVNQSSNDSNVVTPVANSLVVYFSWSGNTELVAQEIQKQSQAEIFEITPQEPYVSDYNELLDIAQEESANDARPTISGTIENFDQYDTIFVGYPNWWGDMPMIMYTLFEQYDFSGKTIIPFVTSGGSGFSGTIASITELEPQATILEGLSISSDGADSSSEDVSTWLQELGLSDE